jgi:hypothetical protein
MTFNLGIALLKSVPKRKPNAKQTMHTVIVDVILIAFVIDEYYGLDSAVLVIVRIILFLI